MPEHSAAPKQRINPTGRTFELAVPLKEGKYYLGDLNTRISKDDVISVPFGPLMKAVNKLLRPTAKTALQNAAGIDLKTEGADKTYINLEKFKAAGFAFHFDPGLMEIKFSPTIEQRVKKSLKPPPPNDFVSKDIAKPADFATYVNVGAAVDYVSKTSSGDTGLGDYRLDFESSTRWKDVVLQVESTFEEEGGINRRGTRLVYDDVDTAIRYQLGDVTPGVTGFQTSPGLLGLSVEKSYQKIKPSQTIQPTGKRSFRLARPSVVQLLNNGKVSRRFRLDPGEYDLDDLPLSAGANNIVLRIEDDLGAKRDINFTVYSDNALLEPGLSLWHFGVGLKSSFGDQSDPKKFLFSDIDPSDILYEIETPIFSGYYKRGLSADLTGQIHFQADPDIMMTGMSVVFPNSMGTFDIELAGSSYKNSAYGGALDFNYSMAKIDWSDGIKRDFRFSAEVFTEKFAAVGEEDPFNQYFAKLSASYSQELPFDINGSLSLDYGFAREGAEDSFTTRLNLSKTFDDSWSGSLSVGYDLYSDKKDDHYLIGDVLNDGFNVGLRLTHKLSQNSILDASHDTATQRSNLGYRYSHGKGVGSIDVDVDVEHVSVSNKDNTTQTNTPTDGSTLVIGVGGGPRTDELSVNGAIGYTANRADFELSSSAAFEGFSAMTDQRTTLRASSSIMFADGHFAIGRQVGNGFAIVTKHNNLNESDLYIGKDKKSPIAKEDWMGSAVIPSITNYRPDNIIYDVDNLPPGYDLGAGKFYLSPKYKSGYVLKVGTDYTVMTLGNLVDASGKPISLIGGEASIEGEKDSKKVTVFTNSSGRFAAQGLKPGKWLINMQTKPPSKYVLNIPDGTVGLYRAGVLKPEGADKLVINDNKERAKK